MSFNIGDRVAVQGKKLGYIRHIGAVEFKKGDYIGVELDRAQGVNDGSVDGKEYFKCPAEHGIFVSPRYVSKFNEQDVAAVLLQTNYRTHLSRKKVNSRQAARTWNVLDNHFEEVGQRQAKVVAKATKQLKSSTKISENTFARQDSMEMDESSVHEVDSDLNSQGSNKPGTPKSRTSSISGESIEDEDPNDLFVGATVEELQQAAADAVEDLELGMLLCIVPGDDYTGVHLKHPLRLENVIDMLESFKSDKTLHFKYFMSLLLQGKNLCDSMGTVQDIKIEEGIKLTVVGDTHGQLQDLYTIFRINGLPSETNWYLFNGDFVDRGPKGCEVIATMIAFKILYPNCVYLNRGNHEARAQNAWMGFEEELLTKYGNESESICMKKSKKYISKNSTSYPNKKQRTDDEDVAEENLDANSDENRALAMRRHMNFFGPGDRLTSLKLYMLCQSFFDSLPLCALIQERVFVCHGGLFRNDGVTINQLRGINRKREPPLEGRSFEDRVYEDLLWSDPRPTATYTRPLKYKRPSDRGAGCEFGPIVTNKFCALNQIALVVRSHECVSEGFEVLHNGRLITIFSASRYCGTQTNKGAFIAFGTDLQPEIQQFYAHAIDKNSFMSEEERETLLEREAIKMIVENICDKRLDLYWYFTQNDSEHTGRCTRVEWSKALVNVLNLDLPFLHYQPKLAELETDRRINYTKFLSRFQIVSANDLGWQDAIIRRICEKLFSLCGADLNRAFSKFDLNNNGQVEYEEFVKTLKNLNVGLTNEQIFELMRSVDVDDDAHIDFKEFANRFSLSFNQVATDYQASNKRIVGLRQSQKSNSMRELEEATAREMPEAPISPRSANKMKLNWSSMDAWTVSKLGEVGKMIFTKTNSLRTAWEGFDKDKKGYIEPNDFVVAVNQYLGLAFAPADIEKLFKAIDTNESNKINVLEFFDAFRPDDRSKKSETWKQGVVQQISNCLYQHRIHLRTAFRLFDRDGNGVITADEFSQGMNSINDLLENPLTTEQIEELRHGLDKNNKGTIDYHEFFTSFSIQDTSARKGLFRTGSSYMDLNDPMFRSNPKKAAVLQTIKSTASSPLRPNSMDLDE